MTMREKIYEIIGPRTENNTQNKTYNMFIVAVSVLSIIPLTFVETQGVLKEVLARTETITVYLLFLDYFLCWLTYDYKLKKHSPWAFIFYPLSPLALLNIMSLLPSLGLLPMQFSILRLCRMIKVLQYSKSCAHIVKVFRKEKKTLLSVLIIAVFYIFLSALIMFVKEGGTTFKNFFDALYWATTALTTVGYGDVYPITTVGRLISMISSLFGIAVIALPAGIVTAGFVDSITEEIEKEEEFKEKKKLEKLKKEEAKKLAKVKDTSKSHSIEEIKDVEEVHKYRKEEELAVGKMKDVEQLEQIIDEKRREIAKLERRYIELKYQAEVGGDFHESDEC